MNVIGRATLVCTGIALLAVANGALRDLVLARFMSDTLARAASTVRLVMIILAVANLTVAWILPSYRGVWQLGALWLALTIGLEILGGHYLFGTSWQKLAHDYNVLQGRIWILVPLVTLLAPAIAAFIKRSP
jgi:hypothetical protein